MIKYKSLKKILLMAQPKWNVMGLPPPMPMTCDKFSQKALVKVNSGAKGWTCGQTLKGTCKLQGGQMTKVNKVTKHKVCDKSYNCLEYVSGLLMVFL